MSKTMYLMYSINQNTPKTVIISCIRDWSAYQNG